jgi:hypothetical protein
MPRDRQEILRRLEDRLSAVSSWLAARRNAGDQHLEHLHARVEAVRRDVSQARKATAHSVHHVLARARATVDDMERDYEAPPPHGALRGEEVQALRRHLRLTATVLPHVSNLDDPGWLPAHEEYERSWDELHRVFEGRPPAATRPDDTNAISRLGAGEDRLERRDLGVSQAPARHERWPRRVAAGARNSQLP